MVECISRILPWMIDQTSCREVPEPMDEDAINDTVALKRNGDLSEYEF